MSDFDQVCVVPYRPRGDGHEFCLITSHSGRWIFPKGNIDPGKTAEQAALQECLEEAGLGGYVVGKLTEYSYTKMGRYTMTVLALLFEITNVEDAWEEDHVRQRRWLPADEVRGVLETENLKEVFRAAMAHLTGSGAADAEREVPARADLEPGVAAVVLLEDDPGRTETMLAELAELAPDHEHVVFDNAPDMLAWLERNLGQTQLISLDHDLGPTRDRGGERFDPGCGRDVVDWLEPRDPICPVITHTSNPLAAPGMQLTLQLAGWASERVVPFSDLEWVTAAWVPAVRRLLDNPTAVSE